MRVDHNRNSVKVIQKNPAKSIDVLTTSNEKTIALKLNDESIFSKKAKHSIPFELLTASIDTPKPYEIKKLPIVEEEQKTSVSTAKPEHKGISGGAIVGFVFILIGLLLILIGLVIPSSGPDISEGCVFLFFGVLIMVIGGVIILISSLVNN